MRCIAWLLALPVSEAVFVVGMAISDEMVVFGFDIQTSEVSQIGVAIACRIEDELLTCSEEEIFTSEPLIGLDTGVIAASETGSTVGMFYAPTAHPWFTTFVFCSVHNATYDSHGELERPDLRCNGGPMHSVLPPSVNASHIASTTYPKEIETNIGVGYVNKDTTVPETVRCLAFGTGLVDSHPLFTCGSSKPLFGDGTTAGELGYLNDKTYGVIKGVSFDNKHFLFFTKTFRRRFSVFSFFQTVFPIIDMISIHICMMFS